ncbi:MAG: HupE/UreJ family protein [Betaproteobacteria bacterium]|nr:HupE/UreJ family protein [Betaproteobacteria bacterium]
MKYALAALVLALASAVAAAHEVRPAFLELRETGPGTYSFLWKKPSGGEIELAIAPVIPSECRLATPGQQLTPGALIVRGTLACPDGLAGKTIVIDGLATTVTDVILRVQHADGRVDSALLKPASPSFTFGAARTVWQRAGAYLRLGVEHILSGIDHLLFVLGLLLIVQGRGRLVATITAFTVAHSLTLGAATLGLLSVPAPPVEASIALSILFLGPEIMRRRRGETSFTLRNPWVVAFAFGLLHGLGFAGALAAVGLPRADIPLALFLFNVGVEVGQLAFVGVLLALAWAARAWAIRWPQVVEMLPGYVVGSMGAFWTIERSVALVTALR